MAHILVIDDEAAIRRFLRISLIAEGHQVSEAVGVTEGMAGQGIAISGAFAVLTSLSISSLAGSMDRDNALLAERSRLLGTLDALLGGLQQAAGEQRAAIAALVDSSTALLERAIASRDRATFERAFAQHLLLFCEHKSHCRLPMRRFFSFVS